MDNQTTEKKLSKWAQEKEKIKAMESTKQKISYLVYYYKIPAFIFLLIIAFLVYLIVSITTNKPDGFYCVTVNDKNNENFTNYLDSSFEDMISYDSRKEQITVSPYATNVTNLKPGYYGNDYDQRTIFYGISDNLYDVMISNKDVINWFGQDDNFEDLSTFLSGDELEKAKDLFVYSNGSDGKSRAYGLDISNTAFFKSSPSKLVSPTISVFSNSKHKKRVHSVLTAILNEK